MRTITAMPQRLSFLLLLLLSLNATLNGQHSHVKASLVSVFRSQALVVRKVSLIMLDQHAMLFDPSVR